MADLDASTLIAVGGLASVITGCLLLIVSWRYGSASAAVIWGVANLFAAIGLMLFGQGKGIEIGIACVVASSALNWVAASRFSGHALRPEWLVAGAVAWLAIGYTGSETFVLTPVRAALCLLLLATYFAGSAYELWRGRSEELQARWPLLFLVAIHALFLAGGAVIALLAPIPTPLPLTATVAIFLEIQVFAIGTAVFMVALIKERSIREHETAASTDSLTGLPNRGAFIAAANVLVTRAESDGRDIASLLFDLDHFKRVNDSYGHRVGDAVIQRFAQVASRNLRRDDLIGRIGGEEFAVVMPGAGRDQAMAVADRIRTAFANESAWIEGEAVKATVSAGLAIHAHEAPRTLFVDLLDRSDRALYVAKANGRNRIQLAPDESATPAYVRYA